jgi:ketohexokinase
MAQILAVGIATLDIVNEVDTYPNEDAEVRALAHSVRRGGNATNTLVVLTQLGHCCSWAGVVVDEPDAAVVAQELRHYGIDTSHCRRLSEGKLSTSYITVSRETGSRTIVHYRDLPEYDADSFSRIPLQDFDWLHFEGRNVDQTVLMLQRARDLAPHIPVSVEVEKPREQVERLFPCADLLVFSQAFARQHELSPTELLQQVRRAAPQADLVCSLGGRGAIAISRAGVVLTVEACPPPRVVDTLGAGDTFNAGMIDALQRGAALREALHFASQLAGAKCGQTGLHGLRIPPRRASDNGQAHI